MSARLETGQNQNARLQCNGTLRWAVWCHRKPVPHSFAASGASTHHRAHLPVHTTHYVLPQRRTQDRANEVRARIYSSMSTCRCILPTLISRSWFLSKLTAHLSKLYYILLCHAQNWNRKLISIYFFT